MARGSPFPSPSYIKLLIPPQFFLTYKRNTRKGGGKGGIEKIVRERSEGGRERAGRETEKREGNK